MKLNKLLVVLLVFAALAGASQIANAGERFYCKYYGELINVFEHIDENGADSNVDFITKCCYYHLTDLKKDGYCRPTIFWRKTGNTIMLALAENRLLSALTIFVEKFNFPLDTYFTWPYTPQEKWKEDYSELMFAIHNNDLNMVEYLLSLRPDTRTPYANPAKENPSYKDAKTVMNEMIDNGAIINPMIIKKVNDLWEKSEKIPYKNRFLDKDGRPETKDGPYTTFNRLEVDAAEIGFDYNHEKTSNKEGIINILQDDKAFADMREKVNHESIH